MIESVSEAVLLPLKIEVGLEVDPELWRDSEVAPQTQGRIRCDASAPMDNFDALQVLLDQPERQGTQARLLIAWDGYSSRRRKRKFLSFARKKAGYRARALLASRLTHRMLILSG